MRFTALIFLLFMSFFSGRILRAQSVPADSLQFILSVGSSPQVTLRRVFDLSTRIPAANFDERMRVSDEGIRLAESIRDSVKLGQFLTMKGSAHYFKGSFDSAAHFFYAAVRILENQPEKTALANTWNEVGKLYRKKREFARAISAYDKSMKIFRDLQDSSGVAMIYNESGVVFEYKGDFDEAKRRYEASLSINRLLKDSVGIAYALNNIGYLFISLEDYPQAEKYLKEALTYRKSLGDTLALSLNYADLGELYSKAGRFSEARQNLRQSLVLAEKLSYPDLLMNNYRNLSEVDSRTGDYRSAYESLSRFILLRDSLYNAETDARIAEISARYETEKRAAENELLRKTVSLRDAELRVREGQNRIQRRTNTFVIILFVVLLLSSVVVYFRIKREQEAKLQLEAASAAEAERRRISRDLHDNLGAQMSLMIQMLDKVSDPDPVLPALKETASQAIMTLRETVWAINNQEISIDNFSDRLKQFVRRQSEFSEGMEVKFEEEISADYVFQPSVALNLYRICQEAFSNALRHARATKVVVRVRTDESGRCNFTVEDNGIGFDCGNGKKDGHFGLENMEFRARESGADFRIHSEPGKGTRVEIFFG